MPATGGAEDRKVLCSYCRRRTPFDASQPCFFLKQEKTLVFQKNQEKDVWHALLSFQGTGPRGLLPADDAVPPAFNKTRFRQKTEPSV